MRTQSEISRILIVEDEQIVAMDVEMQLADLGYEVAGIANTGMEALRLTEAAHPDLILMDIQLQGTLDGVATAEEIRHIWNMPIVFVSAFGSDEMPSRARTISVQGYLSKPCRPEELRAIVASAL